MSVYKTLSVVVIVILFFVRIYFSFQKDYQEGDYIRVSGRVSGEPIRYSDSQMVRVENVRFYLPLYPEIYYGDSLVVEGIVEEDRIKKPTLVSITESKSFLYAFRRKLIMFYEKSLPEPHSSFIAGVTMGSKSGIPERFWEALKKSGTAHVVVASGMNVAFVGGFVLNALAGVINRKKAVIIAIGVIWIYSLLSGFDAPIVRASIMGTFAFMAQRVGRVYLAWRGLIIAVLIMILVRPVWITDLGFILSFVATASLMLFEKRVVRYIGWVPKLLREGLSTSLAAQIGVAPILFVTFGQFSLLSPLINALVLWVIAPITVLGFIGGLAGLVIEPLGRIILYLVYPMSLWFVSVVRLFS